MLSMVLNEVAPPPPPPQIASAASTTTGPAPRFPTYLLPSFSRPLRRRRQSSLSSNSTPATSDVPSLSNSPTDSILESSSAASSPPLGLSVLKDGFRRASTGQARAVKLTKIQPDTIRCSTCGTDFAFYSQIVSKSFTGRYGRAYLVSPPDNHKKKSNTNLINVKVGKPETRILVTGTHVVSYISCATCHANVGWKYVDAKEESQKYKVGKFILETQRTVDYRSWEDVMVDEIAEFEMEQKDADEGNDRESVIFDSDDEDDCDELFAGVWDARTAAKRRKQKMETLGARRRSRNGDTTNGTGWLGGMHGFFTFGIPFT
ncbi:yippee-domain-containing protein [Xylariaceae sp. FL1651]|nr:yippee-domain-containing protein [Xylariaceae sp. FL1651]